MDSDRNEAEGYLLVLLFAVLLFTGAYGYIGMAIGLFWIVAPVVAFCLGLYEEVGYAMVRYRIRQARKKHEELYAEK